MSTISLRNNVHNFCADVDCIDNVYHMHNIYFLCFFLDCYNVFMYVVSVLYSAKVYLNRGLWKCWICIIITNTNNTYVNV